jgi:hypothetical protein
MLVGLLLCAVVCAAPPSVKPSSTEQVAAATIAPSLEVVEVLLAADDPAGALSVLDALEANGALVLDDVLSLWRLRGVARALTDDTTGAVASFIELLTLRPTSALPDGSPARVTTAFAEAQAAMVTRPRLDLAMKLPLGAPLDAPVNMEVVRRSDDRERVTEVVVWHRDKGASTWSQVSARLTGPRVEVQLPARESRTAILDDLGRAGMIIEVALTARDARGSTVFSSPSVDAPVELLVGFDAAPPWYANPWVWVGAGAGIALVAGGATAAAIIATTPSTSLQLSTTVSP